MKKICKKEWLIRGFVFLSILTLTFQFVGYGSSDAAPGPLTVQPLQDIVTASVDLGTPVAKAAKLRQPVTDANNNKHIGIVLMHPYSSSVDNQGCTDLAKRGFTMLCVDSSFTNNQYGYYGYEQHVPAIKASINYLRKQPGITKVILFGRSMGGPMMVFYQNVAENGTSVCTGKEKLSPCVTNNLVDLPAADGLMLNDTHLGEALATFTYIDPAIVNNTFGQRDASLDMFAPANGYNLTTNRATYAPAFRQKFFAAQAARNAQLNAAALDLLAKKRAATKDNSQMGDDIPFTVVGATSARLFQPDLDLLQCTQKPQVMLAHDGTRPVKVVCSVRIPSGAAAEGLSASSTSNTNVHIWLGRMGMRTMGTYSQTINDLTGMDYTSTATTSVGNITGVTKPLLIIANGGHYFLRPDEMVFDAAKMADKTFAITEGSVHASTECTACESQQGLPTGYYGDTFSRTMDYMSDWLRRRY